MRYALLVSVVCCTSSPVAARDMSLVQGAQMVGMAKGCGIALDDAATLDFLSTRVLPLDPNGSLNLAGLIGLGQHQVAGMDQLSKRATCDAMRKHVKAFGLGAK